MSSVIESFLNKLIPLYSLAHQHPLVHVLIDHPFFLPTLLVALLIAAFFSLRPAKKVEVNDDTHAFVKFAQERPPQILSEMLVSSGKPPAASNEDLVAQVARLSAQVQAMQQEFSVFLRRRSAVEEELIDATNKIFRLLSDDHRSISSEELDFPNSRPPLDTSFFNPQPPVLSTLPQQQQQQPQPLQQQWSPPQQHLRPLQPTPQVPQRLVQPPSGGGESSVATSKPSTLPPSPKAPPAALLPVSQPQPQTLTAAVDGGTSLSHAVPDQQQQLTGGGGLPEIRPPQQWRPSVPAMRPVMPGGAPPGGFLRAPPSVPISAGSTEPAAATMLPKAPASRPRPQAKAIVAVADPFASTRA